MLTHISIRSGLSGSMRGGAWFFAGGVGVAFVLFSAIIGLELLLQPRGQVAKLLETVNRTQKGDRLPLVPTFHRMP